MRAVLKKGFLKWLAGTRADIICLQEIKADVGELPPDALRPEGYISFFSPSSLKKGHSGVACYVCKEPKRADYNLGFKKFGKEGRIIRLEYPKFVLFNLYLPHGGRSKENLGYKLEVYNHLLDYLGPLAQKTKNIILTGDFNVAHQEIDLARPKQNQNNVMFTPQERAQLDKLIALGFVDSFRYFVSTGGHYTWWPYFADARARNLGWRIDYAFVSKSLTSKLKDAFILRDITGSDHCPIGIEVEI